MSDVLVRTESNDMVYEDCQFAIGDDGILRVYKNPDVIEAVYKDFIYARMLP